MNDRMRCVWGTLLLLVVAEIRAEPPTQLHLADGESTCEGCVEVFYQGSWSTVCDNLWDLNEAQVVCRQLSCGAAVSAPGWARFGPGNGPIVLSDLGCTGNETLLWECPHRGGNCSDCDHSKDAGVICSEPKSPNSVDNTERPESSSVYNGSRAQIRLSSGKGRCEGRVEVLYNGHWGTVCDDLWNLENAEVVCRVVGCGKAVSAPGQAHFGPGSGSIIMDDVICEGHENALFQCKHKGPSCGNCNHYEDAGVICSDSSHPPSAFPNYLEYGVFIIVQLVNGGDPCAGRVEMFRSFIWHTVCESGLTMKSAKVICEQLGCGTPTALPKLAIFGQAEGLWKPTFSHVGCSGMEVSVTDCTLLQTSDKECTQSNDAGLICSGALSKCKHILTDASGTLSGSGPHGKRTGTFCTWEIRVEKNSRVELELSVSEKETHCVSGFVALFDGTLEMPLLARQCEATDTYRSSSNVMTVLFSSTGASFRASYYSV